MALPNVMNIGRSGMVAAKASIATTGHNISNATTEGFSRQRVLETAATPHNGIGKGTVGDGVRISRIERINDEYLEKQVRNAGRDMSHMEEKDMALRQTEDIFNEMGGDGLNRLVAGFFNDFRKLGNEPDNEAIRQAVRESSKAMVNDFHRLRSEIDDVRKHIDSKIEGYSREINSFAEQVKDLNIQIKQQEIMGGSPNDLMDKRDIALKQLGSYMNLSMHKDNDGQYIVDIQGVGPLVVGPNAESFSVYRSPADDSGKPENGLDLTTSASARGLVTHQIKGGKIGALLEVRDQTLSSILDRLDEMAKTMTDSVNEIHRQGFTRDGQQGVDFFKSIDQTQRASEYIDLSEAVLSNINHIAASAIADAPSDNRIAIAISGLQSAALMSDGKASFDDFYNSIVSDVGVATARNRGAMNQQKDIQSQLGKLREQLSGVSIDEETTNLLQFQHAFDACAKVIQVADEMLKTVLELKR